MNARRSGGRHLAAGRRPAVVVLLALASLFSWSCTSRNGSPPPTPDAGAPSPTSTAAPEGNVAATSLWVAAEGGHSLQEVDLRAGAVRRSFAVGGAPHNIVVSPDGVVAATLPGAGRLVVLEPGGAPREVDLGGAPHDVKLGVST